MRLLRRSRSGLAAGLLLLIAGFLAAASQGTADARPANPLIGRWRSLQNPPDGIGSLFEFREGGAFSYSPGNVIEMPYRIEGDALFLPSEAKGEPEHKAAIQWLADDKIRLTAPGAQNVDLVRKSPKPKPGQTRTILGEWAGPREIGGQSANALYLFRPDGKVLLIMTVLTAQGRYSVDGAKIQMGVPDKWSAEGTFKVEGDTLTLTIDGKKGPKESTYSRY